MCDKNVENKVCGCCGGKYQCEFPMNVVFDTDEFEVRWDLKDIVRKSDRSMIVNVRNWETDDVVLCDECYDKIITDIIARIKSGRAN